MIEWVQALQGAEIGEIPSRASGGVRAARRIADSSCDEWLFREGERRGKGRFALSLTGSKQP